MKHLALLTLVALVAGDSWTDEVDALLAPWDRDDAPGGAVAVLLEGEPVWVRTFGMSNLEADRAVTAESPFYLASLAKPFTAAFVVHAAHAGRLDLDASLREHFPELPVSYAGATLRQCLHHRSGIPDIYDAAIGADLDRVVLSSNVAAIELLTRLPELTFPPGEQFLYSNSGYVLLAEALERSTGSSLAEYAREHGFGPLGMDQAAYVGEERSLASPVSYSRSHAGWVPRKVETGLRGPGGLAMSLADLIRWETAWRDGTWANDELRSALVEAPPPPHHPGLGPYAAGWMLPRLGGLRVERHFGGAFGHTADLIRFPDAGLSVIALSNRADLDAADLGLEVAKSVLGDRYQEPAAPEPFALDHEQRAAFGRIWLDATTRQPWVLLARGNRFQLVSLGDIRLDLAAVSATRLEAIGAQSPFALVLTENDLIIEREGAAPLSLEPVPFPPTDLAPLDEYTGTWRSEELVADIVLFDSGGRLALRQNDPLLELPPFDAVGRDLFLCDRGASLVFVRDENGLTVSLWMDTNRARGLSFERVE